MWNIVFLLFKCLVFFLFLWTLATALWHHNSIKGTWKIGRFGNIYISILILKTQCWMNRSLILYTYNMWLHYCIPSPWDICRSSYCYMPVCTCRLSVYLCFFTKSRNSKKIVLYNCECFPCPCYVYNQIFLLG